ncbi:MAG: ISKra4 family transposase [Deltaproteobacteria bacterium]|nr:ISKra4 family transposase [Deltaproteobacteria bacterium]
MGRRPTRRAGGGLARGGQKGGFKTAFDAEVVREIEALIAPGAADRLDFEAVEIAARRRALSVAARAVQQRLNADTSDHAGPMLQCHCGQPARYAGRRDKTFTTALGEMTLSRAYYHCEACESGFCQRDAALGLEGTSLSPAVTRMTGRAAAMVSFEESHELLEELAGVEVPTKHVERAAEALGREVAEDEKHVVDPLPLEEPVAPTLYLGMDGTGVPMRTSELEGREGKQPDGSSKTREVKLCTLWSAEGRDEEGTPVRDEGSVTYSAAIESAASKDTDEEPSAFAARAMREATRRGFDRAERRAVLGDGAPWIWNVANDHFPEALQIVDRFHAKQHLSDVAKTIWGAKSDSHTPWAKARHDELDAGDIDAVLAALAVHAGTVEEARQCVDYVTTNRDRMKYAEFHAAGLCTSTGVVEARKFAARRRSGRAASGPACTGPWPAPTPSSPCAAASSAAASRTSGNGGPCSAPRHDLPPPPESRCPGFRRSRRAVDSVDWRPLGCGRAADGSRNRAARSPPTTS